MYIVHYITGNVNGLRKLIGKQCCPPTCHSPAGRRPHSEASLYLAEHNNGRICSRMFGAGLFLLVTKNAHISLTRNVALLLIPMAPLGAPHIPARPD